jgi:hypothetical protein
MTLTRRAATAISGLAVVVELSSAILAWGDLRRRTDSQVRGRRSVWCAAIAVHPGNSFAYWALGRLTR